MKTKTQERFYVSPGVQTFQVAIDNHWKFKVVGHGGEIDDPLYKRDWVYEHLSYLPAYGPQEGIRRVKSIKESGVPIKGYIIAHEAPKLLMAPKPQVIIPKDTGKPIAGLSELIGTIGTILLLMLAVFTELVISDPALIVVLDDGTCIEVMTWLESSAS